MLNCRLWLGFVLAAAAASAAAGPPVPMTVPDLVGARSLALGAYRGIASGNDAIWLNAAGLAAMRRYSVETYWLLDQVRDQAALQVIGGSVVDSVTTSVTGGAAYTYVVSGPYTGSIFQVPIAFPVSNGLFLGLTGKYQSLDGPLGDQMRAANLDVSAYYTAQQLGVGFAAYNVFSTGHHLVQPRAVSAGVAYGSDRLFHVAFDWRGDLDRWPEMTSLFAAGGELLLGDTFPIRAGYVYDGTRDASFIGGGLGLVTSAGFAIDISYRQNLTLSSEHTFAAALKLFLAGQ